MNKELSLSAELIKIWNDTPYMENPSRTELADKINDKIETAVKKLKEELKIDWDKGTFVLAGVNERIDEIFGEKIVK